MHRATRGPTLHHSLLLSLSALLLAGCSQDPGTSDFGTPQVFVLTSDFSTTGGYALIDEERRVKPGPDLVGSDSIVRLFDGLIYVVNRGDANIQVIDPANGFKTVRQFSTGTGTNPQDIAVLSPDKAYVALFRSSNEESANPDVLIVNPTTGAITGGIDLSTYADADGLPEASSLVPVGDKVLVALERLDRPSGFKPINQSYLVRLDTATDQASGVLELARPNPFGLLTLAPDGRTLPVPEAADLNDPADGALEMIDAQDFVSLGVTALEAELGGSVIAAAYDLEHLFLILGTPTATGASTEVVQIDPESGEKLATLWTPGEWVCFDLGIDARGMLWVADRSPSAPGLRVYPVDDPRSESFVPFGAELLPPYQVRFLE